MTPPIVDLDYHPFNLRNIGLLHPSFMVSEGYYSEGSMCHGIKPYANPCANPQVIEGAWVAIHLNVSPLTHQEANFASLIRLHDDLVLPDLNYHGLDLLALGLLYPSHIVLKGEGRQRCVSLGIEPHADPRPYLQVFQRADVAAYLDMSALVHQDADLPAVPPSPP